MIIAINYSNEAFKKARKVNTLTAKYLGGVNKVISYGPNDIDMDFRERNSKILSSVRGNGYWLWKPYFIKVTLDRMQDGDYLIYSDAGMLYLKSVDRLIEKMTEVKQDIFLTEIPLLEVQFTHPEVLKKLHGESYMFTNQIQGGLLVVKKTEFSQKFIHDWLSKCQEADMLVADNYDSLNDSIFISHREDQSILSVLAKKYGIKPFSDVTDYGRFPIQYLKKDYLFRNVSRNPLFTIDTTYFLLYRSSNPGIYFIKYLVKTGLSKIGISKFKLLNDWANFKM